MTLPHEPADQDEQYDDPSRGRKRRIMGISIALVVVVGLVLLTGLAWPGWFSSDRKTTNAASSSSSAASPSSSTGDIGADASAALPSELAKPGHHASGSGATGGDSGAAGSAGNQGGAAASPARVAAQAYADAVNAKDANKMVSMVCDLTKVEKYTYIKYFDRQFSKANAKVALAGPTKMKGNFAVTRAHSKASAGGQSKSEDIVISMQKKGGKWCVPSRA